MLSDEEKKALKVVNNRTERLIEELKIEEEDLIDEPKIAYLITQIEANKTLVNFIEKQSKEIEELKEDRKKYAEEYIHNNPWLYKQLDENYILRTEADKLYNKKWEDKIKAKIKEISKEWAEGELDGEWYEFMKYHLESLLEKE